ncbi:MAG: hypothetical protein K1X88_29805 [Nannocystaceae bacterium]|nr:hypothetical protein [Nannocystaceae bacterium]
MMLDRLELDLDAEPFDPAAHRGCGCGCGRCGGARSEGELADFDRARTLDTVARWLVDDLVARAGERDANRLTDAAFHVLHPEHGGRPLEGGGSALAKDWVRLKRELVTPRLAGSSVASTPAPTTSGGGSPAPAPAPTGSKAWSTARVPPGYKVVKRTVGGVERERGLAKYSHDRLDVRLRQLVAQGKLRVTDDEIDTFQRIANVESGGGTQALNTWDSAVVSIGFLQLTLQFGELQAWIRLAPEAFRRYGIAVDEGRTWRIGKERQTAIAGATTAAELRWNGWAQRFYEAGLDDEIIAAQCEQGRRRFVRALGAAKRWLAGQSGAWARFEQAYSGSLPLRGLFQEAYNNKPVGARDAIRLAMKRALARGVTDPAAVYALCKDAVIEAFTALDDRSSGVHIASKTASLHPKG